MADEKTPAAPNKIIVKLRDQGSVFHDPTQQQTIGGKEVKEFLENPRIARALKGGALLKATQEELAEWKKEEAKRPKPDAPGTVAVEVPAGTDVKVEHKAAAPTDEDDNDEHGDKKLPAPPKPHGGRRQ